jgi:transcriptional regulator with XRE-family HTH domain
MISTHRLKSGLSLRKLGEDTGVSFSWLSKLESGKATELPKGQTLVSLARALNVSVAELLIAAGVEPSVVLPDVKTFNRLRKISAVVAL